MAESILPPPYVSRENAAEQARNILEHFRWPDGRPVCPECGSDQPIYKQTRKGVEGYYRCPSQHSHPTGRPVVFTVRTGTLLERSHLPLDKWLYCLWLYGRLPSQHQIPSATALSTAIDINRKTASSLLNHLYQLRYGKVSDDPANQFLLVVMMEMARIREVATRTDQA